MDKRIQKALQTDQLIDITTRGRKTGLAHRIEVRLYNLDGQLLLTGLPGRRSWYANLLAHPEFTLHLKQSVQVDLPARATPILDPPRRREILTRLRDQQNSTIDVEARTQGSPLLEVELLSPSRDSG